MPKWYALVFLALLTPLKASAVSPPPVSGITVAPALLTAQVGSKQNQTSASIGVRNNFEVPVTVSAALNGFDVRNNALVPSTTAEKSLAGVVSLSPAEITIAPGASKNITVQVHNTATLTPGGHYLSLLLTETAVSGMLGSSQLTLRPAVSATLYIIKEDGAVRSVAATSLRLRHSLFSLPATADVSFANRGNVAIVPRGVIQISNRATGVVYKQGVVNQQSAPLYPQAIITLQASLQKIRAIHWPGRYQAALQYRYDGQETTQQILQHFWYVPKLFIAGILLMLTVVTSLLWPQNQRRLRRWWRLARRPARAPYVAPDSSKIAVNSTPIRPHNGIPKNPIGQRRKIDDIKIIK